MNQLFDPNDFPSSRDRLRPTRALTKAVGDAPVGPLPEPWVNPWVVIATRKGPVPYTHWPMLEPNHFGSITTACDLVGRVLARPPSVGSNWQMIPCPACKQYTVAQ